MTEARARILIADDVESICELLQHLLEDEGFITESVNNGCDVIEIVKKTPPDVLLLDVKMPGLNGIEVLRKVKTLEPDLPVVMITAYADINGAVTTIKSGAHDYLSKPFNTHEVIRVVHRALAEQRLKRQVSTLSTRLQTKSNLREMMGPSDEIAPLIADIQQVAPSSLAVLITGERGSGKGLVSRAIHLNSVRSGEPFITADCGSPACGCQEEELFGIETGGSTGRMIRAGRIEMADGGTLYLKNIDKLPLELHGKFRRMMAEGVIKRKDGTADVPIDIRLVTSTRENIEKMVPDGRFDRDLYFRLSEFMVKVPPLRERRDDILYLANLFLDNANIELGKNVKRFDEKAILCLLTHSWPGNVNELGSVIRQTALTADETVEPHHLQLDTGVGPMEAETFYESDMLEERVGCSLKEMMTHHVTIIEKNILENTLRKTGGDQKEAARLLRIDNAAMHSKLHYHGIDTDKTVQPDPEKSHD